MKKIIATVFIAAFMAFGWAETQAQYALGVSYENRSESPEHGFGVHFQNDFSPFPLIGIAGRLHLGYFNESYETTEQGVNVEREDRSFDLGLTGIVSVNAGLVTPYAGVGIGIEFFTREVTATAGNGNVVFAEGDDSGFFYYGLVGIGVSALPILRPYVEYRYRGVTSDDFMPSEYGTFSIGVQLRF